MDARHPHPDDATLFDLIEGALDHALAREVEAHLDGCAECGALVRAALAGSPDTVVPVEPLPQDAAARLHLAVGEAWRERVEGIAAREAAADARAAAAEGHVLAPVVTELRPPAPVPTARAARARRARWLVPSLAAAVLAALAGTSIWLGTQPQSTTTRTETQDATPSADSVGKSAAPQVAPDVASPSGAPAPAAGGAAPQAGIPERGGEVTDQDLRDGVTGAPATAVPPTGIDAFSTAQVCVVDGPSAPIVLPDGRIPQQVLRGPYRLTLVCG